MAFKFKIGLNFNFVTISNTHKACSMRKPNFRFVISQDNKLREIDKNVNYKFARSLTTFLLFRINRKRTILKTFVFQMARVMKILCTF